MMIGMMMLMGGMNMMIEVVCVLAYESPFLSFEAFVDMPSE